MVDGGQALWAEINSGHCSGWNIFLGVANIGLNGATFIFSGKRFVDETKDLNKMLKADGVYDELLDFHNNNGGFLNPDAFLNTSKKPTSQNQMQKLVERQKAPSEIDRVDSAHDNWTTAYSFWQK